MEEMNRVSDYVDVFLREIYSEDNGWACQEFPEVGNYLPDFIFEREENDLCQIIVRIPDPILREDHILSAKGLLDAFKTKFPKKNAKLILAYGELLVRPPKLPSNILAVSIFEEAYGCHAPSYEAHILN